MSKIVVLVDIQNDFVNGSLGSPEAEAIVPKVIDYLKTLKKGDYIFSTFDTHFEGYLETPEGKKLPIEHCVYHQHGWFQPDELSQSISDAFINQNVFKSMFKKYTFGSVELARTIFSLEDKIDEVVFMGLCTDICVISNVLMVKAFCPALKISVKADCCAGVTPEKHEAALEVMRSCQIDII